MDEERYHRMKYDACDKWDHTFGCSSLRFLPACQAATVKPSARVMKSQRERRAEEKEARQRHAIREHRRTQLLWNRGALERRLDTYRGFLIRGPQPRRKGMS